MEKLEVLRRAKLFENLVGDELENLAEMCVRRQYTPGQTIFSEGEVGDALYVLEAGEVDVLRRRSSGGQLRIATLAAPELFGEMSLIDKEYRSATVVARTEAKALSLSNDDLYEFARHHRNGFTLIVINIARVLSSRLREMNRQLLRAGAGAE